MRSTALRLALAGTLASLALVGIGAEAAGAAPAISVVPATDLADGQSVAVSGSGFSAGAFLGLVQCEPGAADVNGCDLGTLSYADADATGAFSTSYVVSRIINVGGTERDCAGGCTIGVGNVADYSEAAGAPISFDPDIPPLPPFEIEVTMASRATVDRAGAVTIRGTVTCNRRAEVYLSGELVEILRQRVPVRAWIWQTLTCDGPTNWTLTATPEIGRFDKEFAAVFLDVWGYAGSADSDDAQLERVVHVK